MLISEAPWMLGILTKQTGRPVMIIITIRSSSKSNTEYDSIVNWPTVAPADPPKSDANRSDWIDHLLGPSGFLAYKE